MAAVGVVKGLVGEVTATDPRGNVRVLKVGDSVAENEVIQSTRGSNVHIDFFNKGFATLGGGDSLRLSADMLNQIAEVAQENASQDQVPAENTTTAQDVENMQQQIEEAIARGEDPTALMEAAAAGPGGTGGGGAGEEGGSFVVVDQDAARGRVTPGYGTTTFRYDYENPYEYDGRDRGGDNGLVRGDVPATPTPEPTPEPTPPLNVTIDLDPIKIGNDNVINMEEAKGEQVTLTGTVGGDAKEGDTVTLTLPNGETIDATVKADLTFEATTTADKLVGGTSVKAEITITDQYGQTASANDSEGYSEKSLNVEIELNDPLIGGDNVINMAESADPATPVQLTGTVGGDAKAGDKVTIQLPNGDTVEAVVKADLTYEADATVGQLQGDKALEATITITDDAGNAASATDDAAWTEQTAALGSDAKVLHEAEGNLTSDEAAAADNTVSGSINVQLTGAGTLTVAGQALEVTVDEAGNQVLPGQVSIDVEGKGELVVELVSDGNGGLSLDYTFKVQEGGVDHDKVAGNDESVTESFKLTLDDAAGNHVEGSLDVTILDDVPTASVNDASGDKVAVFDVDAGADKAGSTITVEANGQAVAEGDYKVENGQVVFDKDVGTNDTKYGTQGESTVVKVTVTDADGDVATAEHTLVSTGAQEGNFAHNVLEGGSGHDIIIGDMGMEIIPQVQNVSLVLDTSSSMWETIGDGSTTRFEATIESLRSMIGDMAAKVTADDSITVNVSLVEFSDMSILHQFGGNTWLTMNHDNAQDMVNMFNAKLDAITAQFNYDGLPSVAKHGGGEISLDAVKDAIINNTSYTEDNYTSITRAEFLDVVKGQGWETVDAYNLNDHQTNYQVAFEAAKEAHASAYQAPEGSNEVVSDKLYFLSDGMPNRFIAANGEDVGIEAWGINGLLAGGYDGLLLDPLAQYFAYGAMDEMPALEDSVAYLEGIYGKEFTAEQREVVEAKLEEFREELMSKFESGDIAGIFGVIDDAKQASVDYIRENPTAYSPEFAELVGDGVEVQVAGISGDDPNFDMGMLNAFDSDGTALAITDASGLEQFFDANQMVDLSGSDVIDGGAGNDIIFGDHVYSDYNDAAPALEGIEALKELTGQDTLEGIKDYLRDNPDVAEQIANGSERDTDQADTLRGGEGDDMLFGQGGDDILMGGAGDDILVGGTGDDLLIGGAGDNLLIGGEGNDTFKFTMDSLQDKAQGDTIADFKVGEDTLDLSDLLTGAKDANDNPLTADGGALSLKVETNEAGEKVITVGIDHGEATGGVDQGHVNVATIHAQDGGFDAIQDNATTQQILDVLNQINQQNNGGF